MWYWIYPSIIFVASLSYFVGRWLFLLGGRACGWYLIEKSSKRRKALLAQAKLEEDEENIRIRPSTKSDNGDWEKVDDHISRIGINRGQAEDEWEGIVGFFHPFW
jgi:alpha-1,2-mannosyltransferase